MSKRKNNTIIYKTKKKESKMTRDATFNTEAPTHPSNSIADL